jgi:voltage-gated potassium channel
VAAEPHMARTAAVVAFQTLATVTVLLVVYYLLPLDRPLNAGTAVLFAASLGLFGAAVAFVVRSILSSSQPRLRAIRGLAVGVPFLLVIFASIYCIVATEQPRAFSEELTRTDSLYFTVTVFTTVGFGDITAVTELARVLVTVQMIVGLLTVGVIAKVVLGAVHTAEARIATTLAERPTEEDTTERSPAGELSPPTPDTSPEGRPPLPVDQP